MSEAGICYGWNGPPTGPQTPFILKKGSHIWGRVIQWSDDNDNSKEEVVRGKKGSDEEEVRYNSPYSPLSNKIWSTQRLPAHRAFRPDASFFNIILRQPTHSIKMIGS